MSPLTRSGTFVQSPTFRSVQVKAWAYSPCVPHFYIDIGQPARSGHPFNLDPGTSVRGRRYTLRIAYTLTDVDLCCSTQYFNFPHRNYHEECATSVAVFVQKSPCLICDVAVAPVCSRHYFLAVLHSHLMPIIGLSGVKWHLNLPSCRDARDRLSDN